MATSCVYDTTGGAAAGADARFPGASIAMGERLQVPRRIARVWSEDVRHVLPHLTEAQLVFVLRQRGEVVDELGVLDRMRLIEQANHALLTGSKAMLCDMAPGKCTNPPHSPVKHPAETPPVC